MFITMQKAACFIQSTDGFWFSDFSNSIRHILTFAGTLTKYAAIPKPPWLSRVGILPDGQTHNLT
jgi:hypothetical protein